MANSRIAAQLRKEVARAKGPQAGTVVRFDLVIEVRSNASAEDARRYTYAAVFTNNHWYVAGER